MERLVFDDSYNVVGNKMAALERIDDLLEDSGAVISNGDADGYGTLVLETVEDGEKYLRIHAIVAQMGEEALSRTVLVDGGHDLVPVLPTLCGMLGDDGPYQREAIAEELLAFCIEAFGVRKIPPHRTLSNILHASAFLPGATLADLPVLLGEGGKTAIMTAVSCMPEGVNRDATEAFMGRPDIDDILADEGAYLRNRLGCLGERMPFGDPDMGVTVGELLRTGHIVLVALPKACHGSWQREAEDDALSALLQRQCLASFMDALPDSFAWRVDSLFNVHSAPKTELQSRRMCALHKQGVRLGHLVTRTRVQERIERRRELLLAGDADGLVAEFG